MTDVNDNVLEEIVENIEKLGYHEVKFDVLASAAFKPTEKPYRTTREQILLQAAERRLSYEYIDALNGKIVRFYLEQDIPGPAEQDNEVPEYHIKRSSFF